MIGNIYLLEKTLEHEAAERQALAQRARQFRVQDDPSVAEHPASSAGSRVLLRIGRLVLTWAVPPS